MIELIVVIAILAILALIAIPRFVGFTSRAKIQADEQQVAIAVNTAKVLLAAGDIAVAGGATDTISLSKATAPYIAIGAGITKPATSKNPLATPLLMFQDMIEVKPLQHYSSISILIDAAGVPTVTYTP